MKKDEISRMVGIALITLGAVILTFTLIAIIWVFWQVFGKSVEGSEWLLICGIWFIPFWIWIPAAGLIMITVGIILRVVAKKSSDKVVTYSNKTIDVGVQETLYLDDIEEENKKV